MRLNVESTPSPNQGMIRRRTPRVATLLLISTLCPRCRQSARNPAHKFSRADGLSLQPRDSGKLAPPPQKLFAGGGRVLVDVLTRQTSSSSLPCCHGATHLGQAEAAEADVQLLQPIALTGEDERLRAACSIARSTPSSSRSSARRLTRARLAGIARGMRQVPRLSLL